MITSLNNFTGVTLETDITIITLKDNLTHSYCSELSWEKDNAMPMGIAKLTMPYSQSIDKYWSTYSDVVIIHANLNNRLKKPITKKSKTATSKITSKKTDDNKIRLQNDEYNYSFIGKVHKVKQKGKTFIVHLEDVGWKFLQKVPAEFRKTYIAGQKLDDAFQAICEFMGVDFAYSLEDLDKYNFAADGYSIEKDGKIIEDTPSILEEFNKKDDEEENPEKTEDEKMADQLKEGQPFEASGLIQYTEEQKKAAENKTNDTKNQALNQLTTNQRTNENNTEETPTEEESPKKEEYEEEFAEKIKDLFKGNTLYDSNVSDPILNYDWITVQPTASTSSTSTSPTTETPGATDNMSQNTTSNPSDTSSNTSSDSSSNTSSNTPSNNDN